MKKKSKHLKVNSTPPAEISDAFNKLFTDHEDLSDFINKKGGIKEGLDFLRACARSGRNGCNDTSTLWLRRYTSAIKAEVEELDQSIPWKWWRSERTDLQNVRIELIDIFHFLMSAAAAAGMDGRDFINLYYQKRKLNFDRQVVGFKKNDNRKLKV